MGEDRPDRREEGGWNVAVMDDKGRWLPEEGEREKRKGKGWGVVILVGNKSLM